MIRLRVDHKDKWMNVGISKDFAVCKSCSEFVDLRVAAYCKKHLAGILKSGRMEFLTGKVRVLDPTAKSLNVPLTEKEEKKREFKTEPLVEDDPKLVYVFPYLSIVNDLKGKCS